MTEENKDGQSISNSYIDELGYAKSSNNVVIDWIVRLFKGAGVGIGAILPGLSGGVLSVIFGIYDPMINFLANLSKKFWKNVRYFLPVLVGALFGIYLFSAVVSGALSNYETIAISLFLGFVAGTIPSLYKKAGIKGRSRGNIGTLVITSVAFIIVMVSAAEFINLTLPETLLTWIFSGSLMGLGLVIPGMSPSNFLLYFNVYEKVTAGITELNLSIVIPVFIGAVLSVLLFAKLMEYLFAKYYATMNHFILGLVIGSTVAILFTHVFVAFPGMSGEPLKIVLVFVAMIVGTVLSYMFSRVEDKVEAQK